MLHRSTLDWFDNHDRLSQIIAGFQPRTQQRQMASLIEQQLTKHKDLICEAGTGIGKTLAYLIPCLGIAEKTIISTATKTLQQQILVKDIPIATQAIDGGFKAHLLKGKENYLSTKRLETILSNMQQLPPSQRHQLGLIYHWAKKTQSGDRSECQQLSDKAAIWRLVCQRPQDTTHPKDFYSQARQKARQADLLIVNHHLLCAELHNLVGHGFNLIQDFSCVVVDEAHHLANTAAMSFSQKLSSYQLHETVTECNQAIFFLEQKQRQLLVEPINQLTRQIQDLQHMLVPFAGQKQLWQKITDTKLNDLFANLLMSQLELHQQLQQLDSDQAQSALNLLQQNCQFLHNLCQPDKNQHVAWFEGLNNNHYTLYLSPLDVSEQLAASRQKLDANWIYTSATLTTNQQFDHFYHSLGIDKTVPAEKLDSPFDYQKQVLWYQTIHQKVSDNTPSNSTLHDFLEQCQRISRLTEGRAFLLFCSYRALHQAKNFFQQQEDHDFHLFCQGDAANEALLRNFKSHTNSILLGTSSFWEGVDIRGQALKFVAIEKLPFANPSDPLIQAKHEWYHQHQRSMFNEEILPRAIIGLRQGVGRLIRDVNDTGIIFIGDQRLFTRSYGRLFINSLPDYKIVTDFEALKKQWYTINQ